MGERGQAATQEKDPGLGGLNGTETYAVMSAEAHDAMTRPYLGSFGYDRNTARLIT